MIAETKLGQVRMTKCTVESVELPHGELSIGCTLNILNDFALFLTGNEGPNEVLAVGVLSSIATLTGADNNTKQQIYSISANFDSEFIFPKGMQPEYISKELADLSNRNKLADMATETIKIRLNQLAEMILPGAQTLIPMKFT